MSKTMVLAVIGGGSSQWMMSLMKDVYLLDAVDGGEIRLVDPDRGGAEAVASMLDRFNAMRGKDYRVSVCDDRAEALGGADFVMTTFSPGSMDAFEYDLEIPDPLRHPAAGLHDGGAGRHLGGAAHRAGRGGGRGGHGAALPGGVAAERHQSR